MLASDNVILNPTDMLACLPSCNCENYHVCSSVDQCDVKSSKKRPLFLVWTNPDPMAQCLSSDFQIIFKTGDGQRTILFIFVRTSYMKLFFILSIVRLHSSKQWLLKALIGTLFVQ